MVAISNLVRRPFDGTGGVSSLRRTLAVTLFALALNVHAALQFDVFVGLDNYVPEASWFPITCEIYNDGPAFNGVIEVSGGMNQGGYPRLVPVELPTGTRKRVTIPVFCSSSYNGEWNVRLEDTQGRTRSEQLSLRPRALVRRNTVLLGSLARTASWAPSFQKILPSQSDYQPAAARLQPALFPDNSIALEGLDALYLNSERVTDLRAQQIGALESWINCGGHLIVGVEQISDVNNAAWLRHLVPIELSGVREVQGGPALEDWLRSPVPRAAAEAVPTPAAGKANKQSKTNLTSQAPFADAVNDPKFDAASLVVATGSLRAGQVVVAAGDTPLIVTHRVGNGRITTILFSPERDPAKSWRNQPTFWSRLAEVPARWYVSEQSYYSGGWGMDGIFGAMIDSRQVRKLPIPWLLLLLLVYLAVIGPVDQIWLRKIGKPMLTWITFPCYVALFSGLIYLVGYKLRAGESEWNELHVVDVFPSGQRTELRGHTFGSIYSPVNQRYTFESSARASSFRSEFSGNYGGNTGNDRGRVVQSENSFKADVFVPVWTCQLYVNDWLQAAEAPFFASVEQTGAGWKASVQNRLDKPLTQVRLVVREQVIELGEVPARQTRQFVQSATNQMTRLADFVGKHGQNFQNVVQQRRSAFGAMEGGRLNDLPNCSVAASFLAKLHAKDQDYTFVTPPAFDLSAAAAADNAIVLAWSGNHSPIKPLNQFSTRRRTVNTLWRQTLPLNPNP